MSTASVVESFCSFVDDPTWVCRPLKGYLFDNDMSPYRRCVPLGVLRDLEPDGVFMDATLSMSGSSWHSTVTLTRDLPAFSSVRYGKLDHHRWIPQSGKPIALYRAQNIRGLCGAKADTMVSIKSGFYERDGCYHPARVRSGSVVGGPGDVDGVSAIMSIVGSAFSERYSAHMEIPLRSGVSVSLPMNLRQIREVLADRDKPESGSRRPALVHLVSSHKRCSADEAVHVREHLRGKISCHWRGWDVTLHPSTFDIDRIGAA